MKKYNQITLFDNDNLIEKSNALSLANTDIKLSLTQMQLLSLAILSREENQTYSKFTLKEFERYADITKYQKIRALKDTVILRKVGFTFMDSDFLEAETASGRMITYNIIESIEYDNGLFQVYWTKKAQPLLQNMLEKYMQIDLTITQKFTSQYSWILYEFLKSHYQRRRLKSLTISLEDLKRAFKVQDITSYNRNFSNFRQKVLDLAIQEINLYSELYVNYTPYYVGKSVRDIVFEWQSARIDYLATRKQIKHLEELHRELETYDSFVTDSKYSSFRQLLMESDFKQFTRNVANANIKRAQTVLKELERLDDFDDSTVSQPLIEDLSSAPHQLEELVYQAVREKLSQNHTIFKKMSYVDIALMLFFNSHYSQQKLENDNINTQTINAICRKIEADFTKYMQMHHKK
ncbi:RepB family plasmid replication initiator protein [Streptococcus pneumoniae]|nr:RepB family plasmid replication initiator protein [Streptococcus pneumoniae]